MNNNESEALVKSLSEMNNDGGELLRKALIECPKCEGKKTKFVKKDSYNRAVLMLIIGVILGIIRPVIISCKVFLYIVSFKISKINRMILDGLWGYVVTIKYLLVVFSLGFVNFTQVYECEDCKKQWTV